MRYVQLRAFHHVAIHGGFSRAAQELGLTQPALSDQVRKLEEEYDILLFSRQRKQIALTPEGGQLLTITRRLFEAEGQALDLLSESRALRAGKLSIMADAVHHVLPLLAAFRARYPGVKVQLRGGNTETVTHALLAYDADIGVIGERPAMGDAVVLPLNRSPIIACVAATHPLAGYGTLPFAEIARHPVVMREAGSKTRKKVEEAAAARGLVLNPAIEVEGREAMREIVAMGLGIGFVSEAEFGHDPRLARLTTADADITMEEVMLCLRERAGGKTIRALFDMARSGLHNPRAAGDQSVMPS